MAQNLPALPDWERISTSVIRVMGGNPGKFTLQGTNTYLLGNGPQRLLIDTGSGERKWIETLRTVLAAEQATVATCILTHWHHDHIGGVKDLEQQVGASAVRVHKHLPTHDPDGLLDASRVHEIQDGQRFSTPAGEFEIQAIHTPGHAKDHMCLQITASPDASEVGALFTADNVLGHGTAVFEDLQLYLGSLDTMRRRVTAAIEAQNERQGRSEGTNGEGEPIVQVAKKHAFPGHGAVIDDAVAKIDEYVKHRRMREEEALNVLRYGTVKAPGSKVAPVHDSITTEGDSASESETSLGPREVAAGKQWESIDMVKVIYRHYPESLYKPAEYGLLMVLEKLRGDGKVIKTADGRWSASEKATL